MKVLFCTNAFEKVANGPAKFAHLLLQEASAAGFEVKILTEEVSFETSDVYKLHLHVPKPLKLFGQFIRMWRYHKAAMKIRNEYPFDVLVYNNAMIGLISLLFFNRTIGMINDDNNSVNSLAAVLLNKAKLNKRIIFYYIEYLACILSKCIIVNSDYLKKNLSRHYHCSDKRFKVLNKGIENGLIDCDRAAIIKGKQAGTILFVKSDFVRGGLFTLIEALKAIDHKIALSIIGPAIEHHRTLKELLKEASVSFELLDYLAPDDIFQKMRQAEIFCVPSKREAFGVANLEAMAMGCKIVTSNVGGIPEAVGSNGLAWLVEPDNANCLRIALMEALSTSIEPRTDEINNHLKKFSSKNVVCHFKMILEGCL